MAVALLGSLAAAQDFPPLYPGTQTVYVQMLINAIEKIDGVEQQFQADFYVSLYWQDPAITMCNATFDPALSWVPDIDFQDTNGKPDTLLDDTYTVICNIGEIAAAATPSNVPWIEFDQRYTGLFKTPLDLHTFPFDTQAASIKIESGNWNSTFLKWEPVTPEAEFEATPLPNGFKVTEWDVKNADLSRFDNYYSTYGQYWNRFQVLVFLDRQPAYYMYKVVSGSILLVYMCIAIFALEVEEADRMMGTLTCFLALISFVFVASSDLPKVAYLTRIDKFCFVSFLFVAMMMFVHAIQYMFREPEGEGEGEKKGGDDAKIEVGAKPGTDTEAGHGGGHKRAGSEGFVSKNKKRCMTMSGTRKRDWGWCIVFGVVYAVAVGGIFA